MEFLNNPDKVLKAFQTSFDSAPTLELGSKDRFVIFSDHHRGDRSHTDFFQPCEKTYNAALGYYLERDFKLALLGDVEELWQVHPRIVMQNYPLTYQLEKEFYDDGRLFRIIGNHDSLWKDKSLVEEYLGGYFPSIEVLDALKLSLPESNTTILLAHGHQGTMLNDTYDWFSRFWFKVLGKTLIHPFKIKYQTPATRYSLREDHETMMFDCAASLNGTSLESGGPNVLLICGHTHHPIFMSQNRIQRIRSGGEKLKQLGGKKNKKRLARLRSQFEYIKADFGLAPHLMELPSHYFNTGCCSFDDRSITGIEITKGKIKLIKWSDQSSHAERVVLASEVISAI